MKKLAYIFLTIVFIITYSCNVDYEDILTDTHETGGQLIIHKQLIPYVVGNVGPYEASFTVSVSKNKTTQVDVYKKFIRKSDGLVSNEALLKSIEISDFGSYSFSFMFSDLVKNLTLDGTELTDTDTEYSIADSFILTYKSKTIEGNESITSTQSNVAIGTRLAGEYEITEGTYINPGFTADTSGAYIRVIESEAIEPDYKVYKSTTIGWGTKFPSWNKPDCNFFYFYVYSDPIEEGGSEYFVEIPGEYNGVQQTLWCSDELANCIDHPSELPDVSCNNYVTYDDENGHDIIRISYGYIRSSGTRQFDEVLTKQ